VIRNFFTPRHLCIVIFLFVLLLSLLFFGSGSMNAIPDKYFYTTAGPMLLLQSLFMLGDTTLSSTDFWDVLIYLGGRELVLYLESNDFLRRSVTVGKHDQRLPFGDNKKTRFFTYMLFRHQEDEKHDSVSQPAHGVARCENEQMETCAVCLSTGCNAVGVWQQKLTLECGHSFHRECITKVLLFGMRQVHRQTKSHGCIPMERESMALVVRCPLCRRDCVWDRNIQPKVRGARCGLDVSINMLVQSLLLCL
jgi:hypothetical protein